MFAFMDSFIMLRMPLSLQWFKVGIEYTCLEIYAVEIHKMEERHM